MPGDNVEMTVELIAIAMDQTQRSAIVRAGAPSARASSLEIIE
jgi:translation elongation factor EF-Tu-like GTPase